MRHIAPLVLLLVLSAPVLAELEEPPLNTAVTAVEVDGTTVRAEARASALGHDVEAVVVARFTPVENAPPRVETYERWSVDGRRKFERGDRKLGRAWEKKLWKLVEEAEQELSAEERKALPRKGKDLLDRLSHRLGKDGSRRIDGAVIAWSISSGRMVHDGRTTTARTAVVTFSAPGPDDVATPRGDEPSGRDGVVTPREGDTPRPRLPLPRRGSGSGSASASGGGRTVVSTETGIREHVYVEANLDRRGATPPADVPPNGEITPSEK